MTRMKKNTKIATIAARVEDKENGNAPFHRVTARLSIFHAAHWYQVYESSFNGEDYFT